MCSLCEMLEHSELEIVQEKTQITLVKPSAELRCGMDQASNQIQLQAGIITSALQTPKASGYCFSAWDPSGIRQLN